MSDSAPAPAGPFDVVVVGGGINGVGIARDAAGRGLRVALCEQHDLGEHTSSASSKLIHGGLRYLELGHFGLVRKSLLERSILLRSAPHLTRSLRFVLPHDARLRPRWLVRCGLWLYDRLGARDSLPTSAEVDLGRDRAGAALRGEYRYGFQYYDGWTDDARLVVLNALDAAERGATILPRTRAIDFKVVDGLWHVGTVTLHGRAATLHARVLVNAAGPWAASVQDAVTRQRSRHGLRLVKGSHIVVPRVIGDDDAYLLPVPDRRVVFALPFEGCYTLIGTTEVDYRGDPAAVAIDPQEIEYLCAAYNRYFRRPIEPAQVVHSFAGVRPLVDGDTGDPRTASRDYALVSARSPAPFIAIFGGKLTTYRLLAEQVTDRLCALLGRRAPRWTARAVLPGGECGELGNYITQLRRAFPWLPPELAQRYARQFGARAKRLLRGANHLDDLGTQVLPGLHVAEIDYLRRCEWAQTAGDILWRRTKLGLHLPANATATLQRWLDAEVREYG
ncbi:MAG: glycerol-3-phosphate dehydrogenase [Steroidobacteraceae bacterium]|nr:glycerol-3-phosphate dehydrogenase [Steroidobacteraceae bacterium]MDW8259616.1 glycerol-3-phosphate dehydrogenase [Gammaproteobacteria bacterium]